MADDEQFNVSAFCETATEDVGKAVCAVNDALASTKSGLNVFFLLFGVSFDNGVYHTSELSCFLVPCSFFRNACTCFTAFSLI